MLNAKETQEILEVYFEECLRFWAGSMKVRDMRKAHELALQDVRCIKHDPFSPYGDLLDVETHKQFIQSYENILEI